ncbi:MAG TPA: hypothetical protein VEX87_20830 [Skermanella sp.]|jgi:hypothetical protein|nr:hypothetical protein [Skermanella sp.]
MDSYPSELSGAPNPLGYALWDLLADETGIIDATMTDGAERHDPPEHLSNETAALRGA